MCTILVTHLCLCATRSVRYCLQIYATGIISRYSIADLYKCVVVL